MNRDYLTASEIEFTVRNRRMPGYLHRSALESLTLADVERAENDLEDYVIRQRKKLANLRALVEGSEATLAALGGCVEDRLPGEEA